MGKLNGNQDFLKEILKILLAGGGYCADGERSDGWMYCREDGPQYVAVERLLSAFGPTTDTVDMVVTSYLDLLSTGALGYACRIVDKWHTSPTIVDRLIRQMARAGWYGRIEHYSKNHRGVGLTPTEVVLLFDHHMKSATYSDYTDERLAKIAKKYMSPSEAREQIARVKKRNLVPID